LKDALNILFLFVAAPSESFDALDFN